MTEGDGRGSSEAGPGGDRRESPRLPVRLMVREVALGGSFDERPGNLALSGAYFTQGHPPEGGRVELRFLLPGRRAEVRVAGEVLGVDQDGEAFGVHVRFVDLPLEDELAIARLLQEATR